MLTRPWILEFHHECFPCSTFSVPIAIDICTMSRFDALVARQAGLYINYFFLWIFFKQFPQTGYALMSAQLERQFLKRCTLWLADSWNTKSKASSPISPMFTSLAVFWNVCTWANDVNDGHISTHGVGVAGEEVEQRTLDLMVWRLFTMNLKAPTKSRRRHIRT